MGEDVAVLIEFDVVFLDGGEGDVEEVVLMG
jgi:hypothetical protein